MLRLYRDDPDPGIHGAAEWLFRRWQADEPLKEIDRELATGKVKGKRQWYINREGQTMMILSTPGEVWTGEGAERRRRQINRSYAIAAKEVTVAQFFRFRKERQSDKQYAPSGDCPVNRITLCDAAAYCNWLSGREGSRRTSRCYEPNEKGEYAEGMKKSANYLQRAGYRLPTGWEWEYALSSGG